MFPIHPQGSASLARPIVSIHLLLLNTPNGMSAAFFQKIAMLHLLHVINSRYHISIISVISLSLICPIILQLSVYHLSINYSSIYLLSSNLQDPCIIYLSTYLSFLNQYLAVNNIQLLSIYSSIYLCIIYLSLVCLSSPYVCETTI